MARSYSRPTIDSLPSHLSYDEWRSWYGSLDVNRGEWVRGEVVPFMPPLVSHADLVDLLHFLIGLFVRRRQLGRVYSESIELWLPLSQAARLPDLVYLAHEHADRLTSHRLEGYADLVLEVVSAGSVMRDWRQKFAEYQAASIPEYVIVDPRPHHQSVAFFQLDSNGRYRAAAPDDRGRLHSRVLPGFWLDPDWLWQDPLPDPLALLNEILAEAAD